MRTAPRILLALALTAAPLAGVAAEAAPALAAGPAITPAWTPPLTLDSGGAEPSIRTAPDGQAAAYVSAPSGLGSNFWRVDQKSNTDGTYSMVASHAVQPDLGTGGGDSEISVGTAVDPATGCAPIAYSGLHNIDLLDNFTTAYSTDCGKTFSLANPYATQNTLTDRQWQTFDGRLTNHLLYHKVDTGQIVDSVSYDAGHTYVTLGTPAGATGVVDANHAFTLQNVKIGNVVTDLSRPVAGVTYPVNGEQVHTLYATFDGSRDAADAVAGQTGSGGYDHLDTVYVAKSTDGGLTWTDTPVYTTPATSTRELDLIFPVIAVDKAGNLYEAWTDGNLIQYSASTDGGTTWSKPYTVNPGEAGAKATGGTADLFPWIAAGSAGNLDVVWYHGEGGNTTGYRNVGTVPSASDPGTTWTVAFAQLSGATTTDAGGAAAPTVQDLSLAVTPPLHRGNVCNNGTTCGVTDTGDRTLLDFFQVAIDNAGRANIAYAADASSPGSASTVYTRQNSGRSLYTGAPLVPLAFGAAGVACTPDGTVFDPTGDATGAALVASTPTPSQDDLDIVKAFFTTTTDASGTATGVTSHLRMKNLGSTGGQYQRFSFSYAGASYVLIASRTVAGATAYNLSVNGTTGATSLGALTGAFDAVKSEIQVNLPFATFNTLATPTTPLGLGGVISGESILSQRYTGAATLTSDTADGACAYVVGTAPLADVVTPDPIVPEAPLALLLPLGALGVAAVMVGRRRRA